MKIKVQNLEAKPNIIDVNLEEIKLIEENDHMHSAHFIIENKEGWELGRYLTIEMAQKVIEQITSYSASEKHEKYFEMPRTNDDLLMREFACFMKTKYFVEEDTKRTRRKSYLCVTKPSYKEFLWEDIIIQEKENEVLLKNVESDDNLTRKEVKKLLKFILEERIKKNISRNEFSKMTGISTRQIQNYDDLIVIPRIDAIFKMLNALGLVIQIVPKDKFL